MSESTAMKSTAAAINDLGAAFYFVPETAAKGKEVGLDAFRLYLLGRGGVMGNVSGQVMHSSFGYFNPETIIPAWDSGVETLSAVEAAEVYWECAADFGRRLMSDVAGLAEFCQAAEKVVAAADGDGFPIFAGIATLALADDLPARAYQLAVVLRELRGGAHLCAIRSAGLAPREAHAVKRPDMVEVFGWGKLEVDSEALQAQLDEAEALTDRALESSYAVLDAAEGAAFVAGCEGMKAAL